MNSRTMKRVAIIISPHYENHAQRYLGDCLDSLRRLDWPGEKLLVKSLASRGATWAGLYPSEIASITMLGDGRELKWEMTKEGLSIETPKTKPCDHAYAFKIVRRKPF